MDASYLARPLGNRACCLPLRARHQTTRDASMPLLQVSLLSVLFILAQETASQELPAEWRVKKYASKSLQTYRLPAATIGLLCPLPLPHPLYSRANLW